MVHAPSTSAITISPSFGCLQPIERFWITRVPASELLIGKSKFGILLNSVNHLLLFTLCDQRRQARFEISVVGLRRFNDLRPAILNRFEIPVETSSDAIIIENNPALPEIVLLRERQKNPLVGEIQQFIDTVTVDMPRWNFLDYELQALLPEEIYLLEKIIPVIDRMANLGVCNADYAFQVRVQCRREDHSNENYVAQDFALPGLVEADEKILRGRNKSRAYDRFYEPVCLYESPVVRIRYEKCSLLVKGDCRVRVSNTPNLVRVRNLCIFLPAMYDQPFFDLLRYGGVWDYPFTV
jgi:hypothetical protein